MIQFGISRLRAYSNGIGSGVTTVGGTGSATIASGSVWIGGKECTVSSSSIDIGTGADTNTGVCWLYAYLPAANSSTANVGFATGSSSIVLNYPNLQTNIAIISQGQFGTGSSSYATAASNSLSGLTGMRTFGRAQNCSLNITFDQAVARGGNLIFANDAKLYNGNIEGTLENADIDGDRLAHLLGADWASGGVGSGTLTITGTQAPVNFMLELQSLTNGETATYRLMKCYSNSITMTIDRENYTIPSMNFQAIGNQSGEVMTIVNT